MTDAEIIEALRGKLSVEGGGHLYGALGTYPALDLFTATLRQAKMPDGSNFPESLSVNQGILEAIPDGEFKRLVADEAKAKETPPRCWFQSERRAGRIMWDVRFCRFLNFWVCAV